MQRRPARKTALRRKQFDWKRARPPASARLPCCSSGIAHQPAAHRICRHSPEPRHLHSDHDYNIILVPRREALAEAYPSPPPSPHANPPGQWCYANTAAADAQADASGCPTLAWRRTT